MSCWGSKSSVNMVLAGHKKWLISQLPTHLHKKYSKYSSSSLEKKVEELKLEKMKQARDLIIWKNKVKKPNKMTIIDMLIFFSLICREKSNELGKIIPTQHLARIIEPYLYPVVENFYNGYNIIVQLGMSTRYFLEKTPYYCNYEYEFYNKKNPKHNFSELYYKIDTKTNYHLIIYFKRNLEYSNWSYVIDFDISKYTIPTEWIYQEDKFSISDLLKISKNFNNFKINILKIFSNKHLEKIRYFRNDNFKLKQLWAVLRILY